MSGQARSKGRNIRIPLGVLSVFSASMLIAFPWSGSVSGWESPQVKDQRSKSLELSLPPGPIPEAADINPAAEQIIRRAIEGDAGAIANEPLLGDILSQIRKDGPIWKGSTLDPASASPSTALPDASSQSGSDLHGPGQTIAVRRRAAEQLLKTIRVLERLDPSLQNESLKTMMHEEAANLLSTDPPADNSRPSFGGHHKIKGDE